MIAKGVGKVIHNVGGTESTQVAVRLPGGPMLLLEMTECSIKEEGIGGQDIEVEIEVREIKHEHSTNG